MVFSGGLGVIGPRTPSVHRASVLSAVYLAAYAVQAGSALLFGALATANGLRRACACTVLTGSPQSSGAREVEEETRLRITGQPDLLCQFMRSCLACFPTAAAELNA